MHYNVGWVSINWSFVEKNVWNHINILVKYLEYFVKIL